MKILFVDDEPYAHIIFRSLFLNEWKNTATIQIEDAMNGYEALEALEQAVEPFTCIMTDIHMPGMGGFLLLESLQNEPFQPPYTAILSAYSDPLYREKAFHLGVKAFYTKPFERHALAGLIQDLKNIEIKH